MSFPRDLLDQAKHLVGKEPKRPKQASLRRAVSTAYYALFHLLTDAAARKFVRGNGPEREALRVALQRAFVHAEMKKVANSFRGGTPPDEWKAAVGAAPVSNDLRTVADAFVELQEARHKADYDMGRTYTRQEAADLIDRCDRAFTAWNECRHNQEARAYLMALLLHSRQRG